MHIIYLIILKGIFWAILYHYYYTAPYIIRPLSGIIIKYVYIYVQHTVRTLLLCIFFPRPYTDIPLYIIHYMCIYIYMLYYVFFGIRTTKLIELPPALLLLFAVRFCSVYLRYSIVHVYIYKYNMCILYYASFILFLQYNNANNDNNSAQCFV